MNARADDVSPLKVNVLETLGQIKAKINHQSRLITENGKEHLVPSLTESVKSYIDLCLTGLKQGAILNDPCEIIYDRGFVAGSVGDGIAHSYLLELMNGDESEFLASVQMKHGVDNKYDVVVRLKNGISMAYYKASGLVGVMVGHVVKWSKVVVQALKDFWAWVKRKASDARNWVSEQFKSKEAEQQIVQPLAA